TWLSGFALLVVVYYLGGGALVDNDVRNISVGSAIAIGIGVLVAGWLIYDLLMLSPLGRNEVAFAVVAYLLIVGLCFGLMQVFSARAAYIHVGGTFGTIMAANVWQRILPAQKKMIAALNQGNKPDERLAA